MTTPLPFLWPYLLVFWTVYVWAFIPEFRIVHRSTTKVPIPSEDRGSHNVILVGASVAMLTAFLVPFVSHWAALSGNRFAWFFIGIFTMILGSLLRRHCFRTLGVFFKGTVTIQADHQVIDTGAYRWVRHPSYTASMLIILGVALSQGNWLGVVVSLLIAIPTYNYRVTVEEQALLASLGAPYAEFLACRKRYIPFIY
jgi:protein-S-isoprenylcysteine O-methyltransferase Ste14